MKCNCENLHCRGNHFPEGKEGKFVRCAKDVGKARANWIGPICDDCAEDMPLADMAVAVSGRLVAPCQHDIGYCTHPECVGYAEGLK